MGEAGCVKDGVFQNVKINGSISADKSKSLVMRKILSYNYADDVAIGAGDRVVGHTFNHVHTYTLPPKCVVINISLFIKKTNKLEGTATRTNEFTIDGHTDAKSLEAVIQGEMLPLLAPGAKWRSLANHTDTPLEFTVSSAILEEDEDVTGAGLGWTELGENLIILEYINL